jgi:hypothetical protein
MGLELPREPSWLDGYTSDCTNQVSIVPLGGSLSVTVATGVCDEKTVAPDVFFLTVLSSDASLGRGKRGATDVFRMETSIFV